MQIIQNLEDIAAHNTWLVKMRGIGTESSKSEREDIPRSSLWELAEKNGILAW